MNMKFFGFFAVLAVFFTAFAEDKITIDKVEQQWPWNNKIDITYTISSDYPERFLGKVSIEAVVNKRSYTVFVGDIYENATVGQHTITWDGAPLGVRRDDCKITATLDYVIVPEGDDYMIVNLIDGSVSYEGLFPDTVSFCGVSGQELSNLRYNVEKYKSTHMPFRKVPKGTYKAKRGTGSFSEWTTDKDYYIGVFTWTHAQYGYVIKNTDGTDATEWGSYETMTRRWTPYAIRGNVDPLGLIKEYDSAEAAINTKRWMPLEILNAKTKMYFDIPTELMHEIACRAGTETTYYWGNDANLASQYAIFGIKVVYSGHYNVQGQYGDPVGTKKPNNWGLYDMVGNDWQWCRNYVSEEAPTDVFTPGSGNSTHWYVRGENLYCSSAADLNCDRRSSALHNSGGGYSFRAAYIVPESQSSDENAEEIVSMPATQVTSSKVFTVDTFLSPRIVKTQEALADLWSVVYAAGETLTVKSPAGENMTLIESATEDGKVAINTILNAGGIWTLTNTSRGTATFAVRHSIFGTLGEGTATSPANLVDEEALVDLISSGTAGVVVFNASAAEGLIDSLIVPYGYRVESAGEGLFRIVESQGGLANISSAPYSLDTEQSGPNRKVICGKQVTASYSVDAVKTSAGATMKLVSPDGIEFSYPAEGNAETDGEVLKLDTIGDWTLSLIRGDNTWTSILSVGQGGFLLKVR
jgi:hypothetical protein